MTLNFNDLPPPPTRSNWDSKLHLESGLSLVKKQLGLQVYTLGLGWRWAPLMSDADDKMADYITVGINKLLSLLGLRNKTY